jgi:hypothetical protein
VSLDGARAGQLRSLKLRVLVREHLGESVSESDLIPVDFSRGAAVLHGDIAWVLVGEQTSRGLGPALLWALKNESTSLNVIADTDAEVLARQATHFTYPIAVWQSEGRLLVRAYAASHAMPTEPKSSHMEFVDIIRESGAAPHVEHGIVTGEVLGLEVCRAVTDEYSGESRLEVGIGAHDREAFALLHGNKPKIEALADVVASVVKQRTPRADPHPFNRLAPERMLRARVLAEPELVGAAELVPSNSPFPRTNVLDVVPCVASGCRPDGSDIVVVFTAGADPDIVPFALDSRDFINPLADLIVAMPETHITRTNRRALELAKSPAQFMGIKPVGIEGELASPA